MMRRGMLLLGALLGMACGDDDPVVPDADPGCLETWCLDDPAPNGWQFTTPEFEVPAGMEYQDCYFIEVPDVNGDGTDFWVDRIQTAINPGSHHMNVFRVATIVMLDGAPGTMVHGENGTGECFRSSNWADWPLVANSQNSSATNPYTDWQLPANVAHKFTPGEKLMVQTHYVNASTQDTPEMGKVGVNFYKSTDAAPMELGTMFATQQSIRICQSDPDVSFSGSCSFPVGDLTIVAANGHFHSRGTQFRIWDWDGVTPQEPATAPFYTSTEWDDPPMSTDLGVAIPSGGGIFWTCDFTWQPPQAPADCAFLNMRDMGPTDDCCYTFGPVVEGSEHCNAFIYYYPKVARTDIFCN